jgi:hypothetical protein
MAESWGRTFDPSAEYSPIVLAGFLGISASNVYQLVKQGRMTGGCSYREAVQSYVAFWRKKADVQSNSIAEISLARKAELDRAKVELTWLQVKKERGELINRLEFSEILGSVFGSIKGQMLSLGKKYNEDVREDIHLLLESWAKLGEVYIDQAERDRERFLQLQRNELEKLEATCTQDVDSKGQEWLKRKAKELRQDGARQPVRVIKEKE